MELFVRELVGGLVWLVANGVYVDARRRGARGAHRFFAFWMGMPLTWVWFFTVREGSQPRVAPPADDEQALLEEVRRDRGRRLAEGTAETNDDMEQEEL
jgi:hypothetical protein